MSALRQCRITGAWAVIAPERGIRPHDAPADRRTVEAPPAADPACPFCPGHEAELPRIVTEIESPRPPGWLARVVPNKYPVMQPAPAGGASAPPRRWRSSCWF